METITATPVTEFLQANRSRFSQDTLRTYKYQLELLETWLRERGQDFASLTPPLFETYLAEHDWSVNTKYIAFCAARSFVRWAYGAQHPLLKHRVRRTVSPQRTLDWEQVRRILDHLDAQATPSGIRNASMVALMLDSGIRASEACRLQVQHLNLEKRIAYVLGKGNKWGYITWGMMADERLHRWLEVRQSLVRSFGKDPGTVYISISGKRPGAPLTPVGVRAIFSRIGKALGIRFSPHDLRRTFATLSLQTGANTRQVQVLGRWSDIRMVERYSQALMIEHIRDTFPFPTDSLNKR